MVQIHQGLIYEVIVPLSSGTYSKLSVALYAAISSVVLNTHSTEWSGSDVEVQLNCTSVPNITS